MTQTQTIPAPAPGGTLSFKEYQRRRNAPPEAAAPAPPFAPVAPAPRPVAPAPRPAAPAPRAVPFHPALAAVLGALVAADGPLRHQNLVRTLTAAGLSKADAKEAVAECQKRGWIEFDIMAKAPGYVLSGCTAVLEEDNE